jgi:hypothetical protein
VYDEALPRPVGPAHTGVVFPCPATGASLVATPPQYCLPRRPTWTAATSRRMEAEESRHAPRALPGNAPAAAIAKEAHEGVSGPGEVRHPSAARRHRTGVRGGRREWGGRRPATS